MNNFKNYIKINENISTSGQLAHEEFINVKEENYDVIINLTDFHSMLHEEDRAVSALELIYIHIPVDMINPKLQNLKDFLNIMESFKGKKILVHCDENYVTSAFMYVYHKYYLKTPFNDIDLSLLEQWCPNKNWQELLKMDISELS